ncbi:GTP-binding protein [Dactylosporangium sp. CA-139114]|uniref:GTP-binding protein n=1 Tax=Dactylosporangium sp. CA-139114 TaxID=3239931 RepID=UPI003D999233
MTIAADRTGTPRTATAVKIVIAGGFGVGKTTLVGAISDITPLTTEAAITTASTHVDDIGAVPDKQTTTVAMDFGRVDLDPTLVLYLFGTPGQQRFWFMWDELLHGAIGAVVLIDPARIADCFAALDFFEHRSVPYVVAVNRFDHAPTFGDGELRLSLQIADTVPLHHLDARNHHDVRNVLVLLVEHALATRRGRAGRPAAPTRS